jgi:hypothetical protein
VLPYFPVSLLARIIGLIAGFLNIPNTRDKEFQEAVGQGKLLMLPDVPSKKPPAIEMAVIRHYPETIMEKLLLSCFENIACD